MWGIKERFSGQRRGNSPNSRITGSRIVDVNHVRPCHVAPKVRRERHFSLVWAINLIGIGSHDSNIATKSTQCARQAMNVSRHSTTTLERVKIFMNLQDAERIKHWTSHPRQPDTQVQL